MNTIIRALGLRAATSAAALTATACLSVPSSGASGDPNRFDSQTTPPPATFATAEESDVVGTIVSLAPDGSSLVVAIRSIAYPSGKVVEFEAPRNKRVVIAAATELQSADPTALPLTTADLLPGLTVHVIAANLGEPGAPVTARAVREVIGSGGAPLPGNLLGDLGQGKNWSFLTRTGATLMPDQNFVKVVLPDGGDPWDVRLYQPFALEPRKTYTLRFRARASSRRIIAVVTGDNMPDKSFVGTGLVQTFGVSPAWKEYQITFQSNEQVDASPDHLAPCFQLGQKSGDVSIADVSMAPGALFADSKGGQLPAKGENLLDAPSDPDAWQLFQTEGARATVVRDDKSLKISIDKSGAEAWHLQLLQPPIDLTEGRAYTVSFVAKASRASEIGISAQVQGGDFHSIGLSQKAGLTTDWKPYSYTFKAAGLVRQHNLAPQFFFGGEGGDTRTVWLSNISLVAE